MAKGSIAKKGGRAPSTHSRAARRATSPGIDTDKSLKDVQPPTPSVNQRPAVLAAHHSGGIAKKTAKRGRRSVLSAKARRRHEKGMDRAAAVFDRTEKKVARSKGQARSLHSRRRAWDDVNEDAAGQAERRASRKKADKAREEEAVRAFFAEGGEMDVEDDGTEEVDGDEEVVEGEGVGGEQRLQQDDVEIPLEGITNISLRDPTSLTLPPLPEDDGDEEL